MFRNSKRQAEAMKEMAAARKRHAANALEWLRRYTIACDHRGERDEAGYETHGNPAAIYRMAEIEAKAAGFDHPGAIPLCMVA
jgi:hypothetical protein